jgi:hypothetical protein
VMGVISKTLIYIYIDMLQFDKTKIKTILVDIA